MKKIIEINTMIARNVYHSESFNFVKAVVEKICEDKISEKALEIHRQSKPNHYMDEYRLYGTKERGIKYHSYFKIEDKEKNKFNIYTLSNETFGYNDFWLKFTISSHDGLLLEYEIKNKEKIKKVVELFDIEFDYCREQTKEEVFDEIIHELRTKGSERNGEYGIEMGLTAIQIYPEDFWAQFYLGFSYAINNQHKKAIKHLEIATKLDPTSYDSYFNLAKSYLVLDQLKKAKTAILTAESLAEDNPVIIFFLATILEKLGEKEEAIKHYKKMLSVSPEKKIIDKRTGKTYSEEAQKRLQELE